MKEMREKGLKDKKKKTAYKNINIKKHHAGGHSMEATPLALSKTVLLKLSSCV